MGGSCTSDQSTSLATSTGASSAPPTGSATTATRSPLPLATSTAAPPEVGCDYEKKEKVPRLYYHSTRMGLEILLMGFIQPQDQHKEKHEKRKCIDCLRTIGDVFRETDHKYFKQSDSGFTTDSRNYAMQATDGAIALAFVFHLTLPDVQDKTVQFWRRGNSNLPISGEHFKGLYVRSFDTGSLRRLLVIAEVCQPTFNDTLVRQGNGEWQTIRALGASLGAAIGAIVCADGESISTKVRAIMTAEATAAPVAEISWAKRALNPADHVIERNRAALKLIFDALPIVDDPPS